MEINRGGHTSAKHQQWHTRPGKNCWSYFYVSFTRHVHWDKEIFVTIWKSSVESRPCLLIHAARGDICALLSAPLVNIYHYHYYQSEFPIYVCSIFRDLYSIFLNFTHKTVQRHMARMTKLGASYYLFGRIVPRARPCKSLPAMHSTKWSSTMPYSSIPLFMVPITCAVEDDGCYFAGILRRQM